MQETKCIIVGGPAHGMTICLNWEPRETETLYVLGPDGERCLAAAHLRDERYSERYLLLHPRATGAQILSMLDA